MLVRNWSVRTKLAVLMLAASLLPLAISAYVDIREHRARLVAGTEDVLAARADQIAREFDSTHTGYARAVQRLAAFPDTTPTVQQADGDASLCRKEFPEFSRPSLQVIQIFGARVSSMATVTWLWQRSGPSSGWICLHGPRYERPRVDHRRFLASTYHPPRRASVRASPI